MARIGFVLSLNCRRSLHGLTLNSPLVHQRKYASARFTPTCVQRSKLQRIEDGVFPKSAFREQRKERYDYYMKNNRVASLATRAGDDKESDDTGNVAVLNYTENGRVSEEHVDEPAIADDDLELDVLREIEEQKKRDIDAYKLPRRKKKAPEALDKNTEPNVSTTLKPKRKRKVSTPTTDSNTDLHFTSHTEFISSLQQLTKDPLEEDGGQIVTHRGSPNAQIMIIGEAPGEQEDIQGVPFVGKSGQLLDQIFWSCALDKHVYVTNAVKRRPRGNRNPTLKEIKYYKPWLMEEIRLVSPGIIVLTGNISLKAVLEESRGITKMRGQWVYWNGIDVMPVFHPSYLLRNEGKKAEMWMDIQEIRERFQTLYPHINLGPIQRAKKKASRN